MSTTAPSPPPIQLRGGALLYKSAPPGPVRWGQDGSDTCVAGTVRDYRYRDAGACRGRFRRGTRVGGVGRGRAGGGRARVGHGAWYGRHRSGGGRQWRVDGATAWLDAACRVRGGHVGAGW